MKKTAQEPKVTENPLYHDTWMLLRKYRDVVWSLELSVQQVRRQFQIGYGSSMEIFSGVSSFFAVLATTVVTTASAAGTRKQAIAIPPMVFGCYYCNAKKWA